MQPLLLLTDIRRPSEDLGAFHLVQSSVFGGLRKDLGPTDPLTLEFKNEPPCLFAGTSAEAIQEKMCASARIS
jgi:hypothetical protein